MAQSERHGWGVLCPPNRGSGLFLCFPKHRREVILLQECLSLPLKCSQLGHTHEAAHVTPWQAGEGDVCSSFTGGDGWSQLLPSQRGKVRPEQRVPARGCREQGAVPTAPAGHLGRSAGGTQVPLPPCLRGVRGKEGLALASLQQMGWQALKFLETSPVLLGWRGGGGGAQGGGHGLGSAQGASTASAVPLCRKARYTHTCP